MDKKEDGRGREKYLERCKLAKRDLREANCSPVADVMLQERCQSPFHRELSPGQISVEHLSSFFSPLASHQAAFVNAVFSLPSPFSFTLCGISEEETLR